MMVWEIYSYWNIEELRGVLEAVTMLTSTSDYGKLISTMILFGIAVVGIANLTGKHDVVEGFRWFFVAIFLYFVMFVPKVDVTLIDRTGTEPAKVVNNVPIALGVFGHTTSKIGDWLTTGYETVMGVITPSYITYDGVKFEGNGLLFGEQVLLNSEMAEPENISFRMNMTSFFDKCVFPEFDTGNIPIQNVLNTNDLWAAIGNVNPSLYVQLYNNDGTPTPAPIDCMTAYTTVLPAMLTNASNAMLQKLGNKNYPDMSDAAAKAAIESVIAGSYGYYLGLSSSASDIIKQQIMTNTFYNATADPGTLTAATMAQQAAEKNYSVLFHVAQNTIPKLRNVIEVILYAMFPVIMVMIVVGGSKGFPVIKSFVIGLFWIQLWAPLYAVMNYLVTSYDRKEFMAHVTLGDEISASHSAAISDMVLSNTELAGMLAMSIPIIAYAIVKGGEMAMTSFVSGSTRPIEQNAAMSSREVSQGNISMGNMSMDNKGFNTVSALDYNMQPSVNNAGLTRIGADNMQHTVNTYGNGNHSTVTDSTGAEQKGAWANYTTAVGQEQRAQQSYSQSVSAVNQSSREAAFGATQVANDVMSQTQGFDVSKAASLSNSVGDKQAAVEGLQASQSAMQSLTNNDQFTRSEALRMSAYVQSEIAGGASLGAIFETGWSAKAGVRLSGDAEQQATAILQSSYSQTSQTEAKEGLSLQNEIATSQELRGQLGVSDRTEQNISGAVQLQSANLEKLKSSLDAKQEASAELSEAKTRREEASVNTASVLGHEAYGPAFAAWSSGDGHMLLNQLAIAQRNGNENEISNITQEAKQSFLEFQTTNNFVSSKLSGNVDTPDISQENQNKIHQIHQNNVDGQKPVVEYNNGRTGVDGIRDGVNTQNKGRNGAFDVQADSISGNRGFEQQYQNEVMKPDMQPSQSDLKAPPKGLTPDEQKEANLPENEKSPYATKEELSNSWYSGLFKRGD